MLFTFLGRELSDFILAELALVDLELTQYAGPMSLRYLRMKLAPCRFAFNIVCSLGSCVQSKL